MISIELARLAELKRKLDSEPYPGWLNDSDFLELARLEFVLGIPETERVSPKRWYRAANKYS